MSPADALIARYKKAERNLVNIIAKKASTGNPARYQRELLRQIRREIARLQLDAPPLAHKLVEEAYWSGYDNAKLGQQFFAGINTRQIEILEENLIQQLSKAANLVGRHMEDTVRAVGLETTSDKLLTGGTVQTMRRKLLGVLVGIEPKAKDGRIGIVRKGGGVISLSAYARLVARTTTAEAATRATAQQAEDWGYDLVRCTTHSDTCAVCSQYQGRIYALTREAANGKYRGPNDEPLRFPFLYDTALNRGYWVIHPNCKHAFSVIDAQSYTRKELAAFSHISMQPFEDVRSDRERRNYAQAQADNRARREDEKQYEKISAVLPNDAPKNFGAFRKMKRANSERYQDLMKDYRYVISQIRSGESRP